MLQFFPDYLLLLPQADAVAFTEDVEMLGVGEEAELPAAAASPSLLHVDEDGSFLAGPTHIPEAARTAKLHLCLASPAVAGSPPISSGSASRLRVIAQLVRGGRGTGASRQWQVLRLIIEFTQQELSGW